MRTRSAKPRTGALQQTVEPSPATPAATFATVLDIMFLSQTGAAGLDIKQLRSICKETRSVVDYYVKTFNMTTNGGVSPQDYRQIIYGAFHLGRGLISHN